MLEEYKKTPAPLVGNTRTCAFCDKRSRNEYTSGIVITFESLFSLITVVSSCLSRTVVLVCRQKRENQRRYRLEIFDQLEIVMRNVSEDVMKANLLLPASSVNINNNQ